MRLCCRRPSNGTWDAASAGPRGVPRCVECVSAVLGSKRTGRGLRAKPAGVAWHVHACWDLMLALCTHGAESMIRLCQQHFRSGLCHATELMIMN